MCISINLEVKMCCEKLLQDSQNGFSNDKDIYVKDAFKYQIKSFHYVSG